MDQVLEQASASWHATQRWQQYDGEFRANLLRIFSLAAFYGVHLLHYYQPLGVLELGAKPSLRFHQAATFLVAAWALMALVTDRSLRNHLFPSWLPYLTSGFDLAFLTALICLGGGLQSPLVVAFPLVLILVSLRFDLVLLRVATVFAGLAYLFICAASRWPELIGGRALERVPRYGQVMTLLAIVVCGIMLGHFIRRFREMAHWYADHKARSSQGGAADGR